VVTVTRRALTGAALLLACAAPLTAQPVTKDSHAAHGAAQGATQGAAQGGWTTLTTLDAWRGYKRQTVPNGWRAVDATTLEKSGDSDDIVTRQQYGDFELELDWKLSPGGNAGIFYRGTEAGDKIYHTGPEYQLLDDASHRDGQNRLTSTAAAYGLYAPPAGVAKPAGEWNSTRIVARGAHVEHWLNGQKVVEYEMWSPDWEAKVKASKFNEWSGYGRAKRGHVAIQGDHAGTLTVRNVRIRELP
jgi:hypothetical protein